MIASEELDVVVLSTPMHTHLPLAEAALATGAHVLLEKPPTPTLDEFHRLLAAADAAGRAVQLGFQSLGSSALPAMRQLVADGAVGEPVRYGALATWVRTEEYWRRTPWAGRRALDGVPVVDGAVTNPLAHAVATGLAIAGATRESDVAGVRLDLYRANDIEADDTSRSSSTSSAAAPGLRPEPHRVAAQRAVHRRRGNGRPPGALVHARRDPALRAGRQVPHDHRPSAQGPAGEPRRPCRRRRAAARAGGGHGRVHARARGRAHGRGTDPHRALRSSTDGWATRARTAWCATSRPGAARVVTEGRTFAELGAPWSRGA